jgi:thiosulfate/3-mercaptopyruvate sulfurtransferase
VPTFRTPVATREEYFAGHFAGTELDRYPGTHPGHSPNGLNPHWANLLDPESRKLLSVDVIRERFAKAGISSDRPITLTCGSGPTACILALGLRLAGNDRWRVCGG